METKLDTNVFSQQKRKADSSSELRFITELGRSLLFTVHPKKVASRVAEAIGVEVGCVCAFIAELDQVGLISCAFNANGESLPNNLNKRRFKKWLSLLPPQISVSSEDEKNFLLNEKNHKFEYVSPLHINGQVKGAVIVGFDKKEYCRETNRRLIDAATQMAAMSVNLSTHYESAMDASLNSAKEEHRKFTETVLDALPVSLYVIDQNYRIVTWNKHREIGIQGVPRDEVIGRNISEILTNLPQDQLNKEFQRAFQTGVIERTEQRLTDDNGQTKHWMVSKIPMRNKTSNEITHVITVGEDVTQRVEAIHAVGRAEKLAAVGRLAAGVVHEINNPLATISACAEALENRVFEGAFSDSPEVGDLKEYLGLIRSETFRCKTITNGLLDFSRVRSSHRDPVNIGETIKNCVRLIAHQSRSDNVEIRIEKSENLPLINADEGQIQQAIIALATNAIDAMPDGGTLTFRSFSERGRVFVEVQDTGIGIHPDDTPKIFEPFFTTKKIGKGTGLGLSVCYGIVTEHNGRLSVRSNIGVGNNLYHLTSNSQIKGKFMARLLVVDDENNLRLVVQKELSRLGHEVETESDGELAWSALEQKDFDVLLCDIDMPRLDGMSLLRRLREKRHNPPEVIMLTGHATVETAIEAMKLGAYDYLTKPYRITELAALVTQASEKQKLKIDNQRLRAQLERNTSLPDIVAESPQMKEVLRLAQRVARSETSVLITGESGTGKELIAQALHRLSSRAKQSFIDLNCAALQDSLLESELFGHEAGAFSGARARKFGLFEMADGGTLFLDEIMEMPMALQSKLLRALETKSFFRVGGVRKVEVDVRLIAATNRLPEQAVAEGNFRSDLLYRVNSFEINIPPLRERREDIEPLARHILQKIGGVNAPELSPQTVDALCSYHWMGNVRQLRNCLERAILLADNGIIKTKDLPPEVVYRTSEPRVSVSYSSPKEIITAAAGGFQNTPPIALRDIEKQQIIHALEKTGWHRGKTAELLGISPSTLYRRLREYDLETR